MKQTTKFALAILLVILTFTLVLTSCNNESISNSNNNSSNDSSLNDMQEDIKEDNTPKHILSSTTTNIQLNADNSFTAIEYFTSTYNIEIWYTIENVDVVLCEWGEFNNSQIPLTFKAQGNGTTRVYVYISSDGNYQNAVDSIILTVTATGMETGSEGLYYTQKGNSYEVSYGNCTETDIIIPSTYKGLPVTSISVWAFMNSNIKSISIPESITHIGSSAFQGCKNLTSITIPNNVSSIEDDTFYECSSLTSVYLPEDLQSIGKDAFKGCKNLTSITIPNNVSSIEYGSFEGCSSLTSVELPENLQSIGKYAFRECKNLTSITIPNNVSSIENSAFYECSSLTFVDLPENLQSISESAFHGTNISVLKTGNNLRTIEGYAFYDCRNLTTVILSDSVQTIDEYAFAGCVRLTNLYLGSGLTDIGHGAFIGNINHAFYNGTSTKWKKIINEGLECDVFIGEQPVGDIVNIADRMTKSLVVAGANNGTMYLLAQFKNISNYDNISEYDFVIEVYDTDGTLSYLYTYTILSDGTNSLNNIFEIPSGANGYEVIISQIGIRYKDGHIERAFTDYSKTLNSGTIITDIDEYKIVKPNKTTA